MNTARRRIARFINRYEAVTSIEYALIAALVALAIIGGVNALGLNLGALYNQILTSIANALS